jgi:hypothetical protein
MTICLIFKPNNVDSARISHSNPHLLPSFLRFSPRNLLEKSLCSFSLIRISKMPRETISDCIWLIYCSNGGLQKLVSRAQITEKIQKIRLISKSDKIN